MSWKPHSPEYVEQLRREGASWDVIGVQLGVDRRKVKYWADRNLPAALLKPLPRAARQVSAEEIRVMIEDEKLTDTECAARIGMTSNAFRRLRARRGFLRTESVTHKKMTEEQIERMADLLDEGYSYAAISQIMGVTPRTVWRHHPGRGFTHEQTVEAALMARRLNRVA